MISTLPLTDHRWRQCHRPDQPGCQLPRWVSELLADPASLTFAFADPSGVTIATGAIIAPRVRFSWALAFLYMGDNATPHLTSILRQAHRLLRSHGPRYGELRHSVPVGGVQDTERLLLHFGFRRVLEEPQMGADGQPFIWFQQRFGYGLN
jgi:hypothetical protein